MSQASTSTNTSAMDVDLLSVNSPMTSGTATHDESDQDDQPRKRSRRGGKKSRRMAGYLAGIVHVPMDIFAQITSHLRPLDIHTLARTNNKFRKLLMNRSSRHIWLAAERNVPGLPLCPEHITNPEYAALVFGKWCSMCATTTNVTRRMDEFLAVKLCSGCRDKYIVGESHIAFSALPFVRLSTAVKQPSTIHATYGLMNEINWVISLVFDLASRGETATLERWKAERVAQLKKQAEFVRALVPFLDALEDQRDDEIEELKERRFAAIKQRLMGSGWEEVDCYVTHYPLLREWEKLVAVPKLLTNRTWENIKPKLEPILQANKQARLIRERKHRREERKARLLNLVADIGAANPQIIELAEHPGVSLAIPFPKDKRILKLRPIHEIMEQDVSGDVAEEVFMTVREEVEEETRRWRQVVAEQLAGKLKPRGFAGLILPIRSRYSSPPAPVALSTQFTPQSLPYFPSNDLRKLLRADSVFQLDHGRDFKCRFFPDVVVDVQNRYLLRQQQHLTSNDTDDEDIGYERYERSYELPGAMDLSEIQSHSNGMRLARAFLAQLGMRDAAYLEMKALGRRFLCGRCWVQTPMTWVEILEHWSQTTTYHWPYSIQVSLQEKGILCKEEHHLVKESDHLALKPAPETSASEAPEGGTARPLIKLITDEEAEALANDTSPQFMCVVCDTVSSMNDGQGLGGKPIPRPKGRKEAILNHLINVHDTPEERREKMIVECT